MINLKQNNSESVHTDFCEEYLSFKNKQFISLKWRLFFCPIIKSQNLGLVPVLLQAAMRFSAWMLCYWWHLLNLLYAPLFPGKYLIIQNYLDAIGELFPNKIFPMDKWLELLCKFLSSRLISKQPMLSRAQCLATMDFASI